jgi:RNA polymerase sigma-70 factor (ECF subfamily)
MTTPERESELEVFRAIYPQARRFAAFVAGAGVEPDDLVQEALARVLARGSLSDLAEPAAYLRTTMLNLVRNEHRRRTRESAALTRLHPHGPEPTLDLDSLSSTEEVVRALQSLPLPARAAVYLVDLEGLSIGEAAAVVGLSVTATRARLSRARRALRDHAVTREEQA